MGGVNGDGGRVVVVAVVVANRAVSEPPTGKAARPRGPVRNRGPKGRHCYNHDDMRSLIMSHQFYIVKVRCIKL